MLVSGTSGRITAIVDFVGIGNCKLSRSSVEGPYFICADTKNAHNIAEGFAGTPLTLALRVTDHECTPLPGAVVDAWQCDARGNYSGHAVNPDNPPRVNRDDPREPDSPTRFLRGVPATDADGIVEFDAIYPGFYNRRAIHTHYKVYLGNTAYLTSQALYPEEWNEKIVANPVHGEGRRTNRVLNANDNIGRTGVLFNVSERGNRLLATINLAIQT